MTSIQMSTLSTHAPKALAVLRIITALLFIEHGTQKLFGFPPSQMQMDLQGLMLVAALLETIGGVLILIGLFTRPVAFVLSGFMAVAYWMAHAPMNFFPVINMGEPAILFCFIFLYLVFSGPGDWSLDGMRKRA